MTNALYREQRYPFAFCLLLVIVVASAAYLPWMFPARELFRQEGLYAVEAEEFSFQQFMVTVHHIGISNEYPLFPAICRAVGDWLSFDPVVIMRVVNLIMLFATAVVIYFASNSDPDYRSGFMASAMYLTSMVTIEKCVDGTPATLAGFLLLLAQLLFFYFSISRKNWLLAWLVSALLLGLSFLAGGIRMIFYFAIPMVFFRRPLSVKERLDGYFLLGLLLLGLMVAIWAVPYLYFYDKMPFDTDLSFSGLFRNLWEFPIMLVIRIFPWILVAWMPFCAALQERDNTPAFSLCLRTLVFANLLLLCFLPNSDPRDIIFVLAPLSILTGRYYKMGVIRYGMRMRRFFVLCDLGIIGILVYYLLVCVARTEYIPWDWLRNFVADNQKNGLTDVCGISMLVLLALSARKLRQQSPMWMYLLSVAMAVVCITSGPYLFHKMSNTAKRDFGAMLGEKLRDADRLYVVGKSKLYAELFYAGRPVYRLEDEDDIPDEPDTVYLLHGEFPLAEKNRIWVNLLPDDFKYEDRTVCLWKGIRQQEDDQEEN